MDLRRLEVFAKVATDSLTLLRHYKAHQSDWNLPLRVRVVRVVMPERPEADQMALKLRSETQADSLLAIARRAGTDYSGEVTEESDSVLFRASMRAGAGAVLGPEPVHDGWSVTRVVSVLPGRGRSFSEVRVLVEHDWNAREGERSMRAFCDRAREALGVRLNPPALAQVVAR